ncbi:S8 family serine peptidase [bacterium]|nr:S8 family serine peptidase [bacterium]
MLRPVQVLYWLFLSLSASLAGLLPRCSAEDANREFVHGLMPRQETGALDFIRQHPEWDGRGVVVAIFDTGVDPGAIGLQTTIDGRPKVVDIVDATGSGDVDTSKVVKPEDSKVTGLSGRTLTLDPNWKIPSGEVRIGMKAGFELYPHELVDRVKEHRRREFLKKQRALETQLRAEIETFNKEKSGVEKAELEKRLDVLTAATKNYSDPGPVYDCVVFHDGECWRGAVDTDEDGCFDDEKAMTNFRVAREFTRFDDVSLLNFGVNIYEDGDVLSIVADSHPHGTHVAGIVAGHYPDQPEWNGVAPGAQIVSVKIGDTYLDGMETGKALIRATKTVLENHCDLINMSFGEPTKTPNRGLIIRYFDELVRKHGVIFCASAGNAGPALSTVGAPGGTTSSLIGIGAYVSPEMAAAQYALRERGPDRPYTWTSRGPTFDGDIGVNLFAPGGAFAPVPQWTLEKSMQMNGTSMASPNCCGNFALVLSAAKAEKIPYSPTSVRRAFENTARHIDDASPWAQGAGLIQTPAAFEALARDAGRNSERLPLEVSVVGGGRGIYLREAHEAGDDAQPQEFRVTVKPDFHPDAAADEKVAYRIRLKLVSTADWVHCGEQVTVTSTGEMLSVLVDPRKLSPGAHFAEVLGLDVEHLERGPLFRLPITVTRLIPTDDVIGVDLEIDKEERPAEEVSEADTTRDATLTLVMRGGQTIEASLQHGWQEEELRDFEPGSISRRFIPVPNDATWAEVRFHLDAPEGGRHRMFMVHAVQAVPGWTNRDGESNNFVVLQHDVPKSISFRIEPGRTMELAIAQYWSSLGPCRLHYELTFFGIKPDQKQVALTPGEPAVPVEVSSPLHYSKIAPTAKLDTLRHLIKPASATIRQLAEDRDGFDDNRRFHQLELSYSIEQSSSGSVRPRFLLTDDLLYDSEFGGTVWAIFEAGGRRIATDDIWPAAVQLDNGSYTLKLWIRHDDRSKLDALKSMPLALEHSLDSPITLPVYATRVDAVNGGPKFGSATLRPDEHLRLWVGNVTKAPAGALAGDTLLGTISYGEVISDVENRKRPEGFPLSVVVSPTDADNGSSSASSGPAYEDYDEPATGKNADQPKQKLARQARTARLELIAGLSLETERETFDQETESLLKKNEADLTVLALRLQRLDNVKWRKDHLEEIIAAADAVIAQIDQSEVALALIGRTVDDDKEGTAKRKRAEKLKSLLIDTLYRKGRAIGYRELPEVVEQHPIKDQKTQDKQFEAAYAALAKWVDPADKTHFLLHIRREARNGNYGEALKTLNAHGSESNYWHIEKRRKLYEQLGWDHLTENTWHWRTVRFPHGEP